MSEKKLPDHNASMRNKNLIKFGGNIAAKRKTKTDGYAINVGKESQANILYNINADMRKHYKQSCGHCAIANCQYRYGETPNMLAKALNEGEDKDGALSRFRDRVKLKTSYGSYENGDISCERLMEQPRIKKQEKFDARNEIYTQKLMGQVEEILEARAETEPELIEPTLEKVSVKLAGPNQYADEDSDWKAYMAEDLGMGVEVEEDSADSTLYIQEEVDQITFDDL